MALNVYFTGIAAVICSGVILKKTRMFTGEPSPFVMELPAYRWPAANSVLRNMWERSRSFINKAGTVILLLAVVIWFLQNFGIENGKFGMVENLSDGILAVIGNAIAWIFAPLGWSKWQAAVAAITGLVAKKTWLAYSGYFMALPELAGKAPKCGGLCRQVLAPWQGIRSFCSISFARPVLRPLAQLSGK